jgi:hypothetical protein
MVTIQKPTYEPYPQLEVVAAYDSFLLFERLGQALATMRFRPSDGQPITKTFAFLCMALENCAGQTLQERWQDFEQRVWPVWLAGQDRPPGKRWTGAVHIAVTTRLVRPGWDFLCTTYTTTWVRHLPEDEPLVQQAKLLMPTNCATRWGDLESCP